MSQYVEWGDQQEQLCANDHPPKGMQTNSINATTRANRSHNWEGLCDNLDRGHLNMQL